FWEGACAMSTSVRDSHAPQDEPVSSDESRPRCRSKRKLRQARAAKRARRKRLLIGAISLVVLLSIGLSAFFLRPRDKAAVVSVDQSETPAAAPIVEQPISVAQATPKLVPVLQPAPKAEVKPTAPPAPAWEQLDVMPALLEEPAAT